MIQEHDLYPVQGSHHRRKRIGRGNGSGHGTYSGRGIKGQKAREGKPRRGFEGGQLPIQRRMPYKRGFRNRFRVEYEVINVGRIEELELEGTIDQLALARAGVIDLGRPLKILGDGDLTRAIHVRAEKVSAGARAKIEAAGGTVEVIGAAESGDQAE